MTTKIIAVSYPSGNSRIIISNNKKPNYSIFSCVEDNRLKEMFVELLFTHAYNYLLVKYNNILYVIDPLDKNKMTYSKRVVNYHPLSEVIAG